mmetsp:Transcript_7458/g.22047  ORF Transcript_7458/g.22047 Transcript_7458/m.22047 type:complete len:298 (-) Transcript_7458:423-1316(-)
MTFAAALLVSENLICQHGVGGQPRLPRCTFSRAPPLPAHSSASLLQRLHPSSRQQGTCTQATRLQDQSSSSREQEIEGLDKNYCDDFVCSSSPAVEQAVRSLAQDIQQPKRWSRQLFVEDVQYKGGWRSFKGIDRYSRHLFIADNIDKAKVTVQRMRMEGLGAAVISWRLQGRVVKVLDIDVRVESTFQLNMLTGRVESHTDEWDLSQCSPPAAAAFTALRAGWAFRQKTIDLQEDSGKFFDSFQSKQAPQITGDPTDPRKFFIEEDNTFKDAVLFASVLALFWLFYKAQFLIAEIK